MLWKILSGLSVICLGAGLWFSYQNKGAIREEMNLLKRAEGNLNDVKLSQAKAAEAKTKKTKDLEDVTKQRDDARVEVAKTNAGIDEKQKEVDTLKATLAEAQKQLAQMNEEIRKAGDIEKLLAEVESLTKQVKDSEAAIANQEQQMALTQDKIAAVNNQIANLKEVDARQKRGQVGPEFNARIAANYPDYGFVVLNKGNLGGVFANAMLNVKRGGSVIAKLKVRDVEQAQSVADLVPGSLASGESLRSGDLVVAAPAPPPPAESPPAPAAPTPAAAGPAAGAAAAPPGGMAPPADPFGMAPAPAPAAGTAPAAPADPFGMAPAPAPPAGTPPPAPGGEGTPQKPSTADPFAPAPPKP